MFFSFCTALELVTLCVTETSHRFPQPRVAALKCSSCGIIVAIQTVEHDTWIHRLIQAVIRCLKL